MNLAIFTFAIILFVLPWQSEAIVGGHEAKKPPPDDPVVFVTRRGQSARVQGEYKNKMYSFKGMHYAQTPNDTLRFQRPVIYTLQGNVDATRFGDVCPQPNPVTDGSNLPDVIGSEDCLTLNVFTEELANGTEGLPVIFWIHGGGFRTGSAAQYDPKPLTEKKLLVVTIQYRLGSLGFLSTGNPDQPGNAAMFDIALALRWVRDYIGFFGGNPMNVVAMGQGSGASSAVLAALSGPSKGHVQGLIAMSGTALSHWTVDGVPEKTASKISNQHNCSTENIVEMVRCLQNIRYDDIVKGDNEIDKNWWQTNNIANNMVGLRSAAPVVEGPYDSRSLPTFLTNQPLQTMKSGDCAKIPLMTGVTRDETAAAVLDKDKIDLVRQIKNIPQFLEKRLVQDLKSVADILKPGFVNTPKTGLGYLSPVLEHVGKLLPRFRRADLPVSVNDLTSVINGVTDLQFANYLHLADPKNIDEALNKIIEATGDALFNLPAILTANLWSNTGSPTYFYRFEHKGNMSRGHLFLNNLPLVSHNPSIYNDPTKIMHGDDLGYIFNPMSIDGSRSLVNHGKLTAEDEAVRDTFTSMIAEFASLTMNQRGKDTGLLAKYSPQENNYLSIKPKPETLTNFRYCEIALWGGLVERLQSSSCDFLSAVQENYDTAQKTVGKSVGDVQSVAQNPGDSLGNTATNLTNKFTGLLWG